MSRVLIMSSWTSVPDVGLSVAAPVLQALGHQVTQLPTIILANHPGRPRSAGRPLPPEQLDEMIDAIDANGWLAGHDALLTGYLPSAAHVALACSLAARLRKQAPAATVVVDPILGDDPGGLYLDAKAAAAIRRDLIPLADVLTPNRFELAWLTGKPAATLPEARAAAEALLGGRCRQVLVTSAPVPGGDTGVLAVRTAGTALFRAPRHPRVPHGAGDVFAAMIAAGLTVGAALGHLQALVTASIGADHLAIAGAADHWRTAPPIAPGPLPGCPED